MSEFTGKKIDELNIDQLRHITRCDPSFVLTHLKDKTIFDVELIRLMFDLAREEAKRRMETGVYAM